MMRKWANEKIVILRPKAHFRRRTSSSSRKVLAQKARSAEGSLRFFAPLRMTLVLSLIFLFGFISMALAQDSNVQIQKSEDRTGALVTTPKTARKQVSGNPVDRLFSVFENGVMGIAVPTSHWSGKAVDGVVLGVEKTGTVLFSRFFHLVDLKGKWTNSKKTSR